MLKRSLLLGLLLSANAYAFRYGTAGCGLGSVILKDEPGMAQVVASFLNNYVVPQTSAITTGTLNCYEGEDEEVSLNYIDTNKLALKEDVARGSGETLDGLMTLLNCQDTQGTKVEIKKNYNQFFESNDSKKILESIQKTCNHVG